MMISNKKISIKDLNNEFAALSLQIEKQTLPSGFAQFVLYALSELFANVQEHSYSEGVVLSLKIIQKKFSLSISDDGIGLRGSYLKKGIRPKDDFSAIQFALSGLSTKDKSGRGFGLYTIKKCVNSINGVMVVKSGQALVRVFQDKIEPKTLRKNKNGTEIIVETPIKKVDFYKNIE